MFCNLQDPKERSSFVDIAAKLNKPASVKKIHRLTLADHSQTQVLLKIDMQARIDQEFKLPDTTKSMLC